MGSIGRGLLRKQAKKAYKEKAKTVPKKSRMSFAQFFEQYKKMKSTQSEGELDIANPEVEDFDFEDMINVNEDLVVEEE